MCHVYYFWIDVFICGLDSYSDGTIPFREDPFVSKWCKAKFLQICSDEETNLSTSWVAWGWVHFQQLLYFFWVNYYFNGNIPQKTYSHQDKSRIEIQASKVAFDL